MKITLQELRKLIREELTQAHKDLGSNDDEIEVGTNVAVAGPNSPVAGKVVNRYAGVAGKDATWTVKTQGGKTVQKKAHDLKAIKDDKPGEVEKHKPDDEKEDDTENLLVDKELREIDEKAEEEEFKEKHYEFIAHQILNKWSGTTPEMSWKAVADNYVRAAKASTGKVLDSEKLYIAIEKVRDESLEGIDMCYHDKTSR